MPFLFKKNSQRESGRTMAETLAVLSIVGVLAIFGVVCYYLVLDKHGAEDILNKANQRAMVISNQITENLPLTLRGFKEDKDIFPNTFAFINKSQFKLFLTNIEPDICAQIKNMAPSKSVIKKVDEKCAFFVYNKDYSSEMSPVCNEGNFIENNQCKPCILGDRECMCPDDTPYSDGKGGCCHYVENYTDNTLTVLDGETCCPKGYENAIQGNCCPEDNPSC